MAAQTTQRPRRPIAARPAGPSGRSTEWMGFAACRGADPGLFFPEPREDTAEAKQVCRGCPVYADCLFYALLEPDKTRSGIWGGTTESEREALRQWDRSIRGRGATR